MANVVEIEVRGDDRTGPAFGSARRGMDQLIRDANGRLHDSRGRFAAEGRAAGEAYGDGVEEGAERGFKGMEGGLGEALSGLKTLAMAAAADIGASVAGPLVAAAGAGAAAFASAGAAAGAFGLAVKPQAAAIGEVSAAWEKYQAAEPNTEARDKAFKEYIKTLDKLPPATQEAAGEFLTLKDAFKNWSDSLAGDTMPVFTKGLRIARELLPSLTPLVKAGAESLSGFMDTLAKDAQGGGIQKFTTKLADAARKVLPDLLASVRNVAIGFGGIISAFLPFSSNISGGLEKLTEKFADFGKNLGDNKGFQDWMAGVSDEAPGLIDMLGDLVHIILNVAEAMAPFTGLTLKVTEALADFVAAIPQDVMNWLAPTIGGIVLAIKAWSVVQGILNVVLAANPIGLVVLAIAGLVGGLIYAYKHSETFRRIVNEAFSVVKEKGLALWEKLKPGLEKMADLLGETLPEAATYLSEKLGDLASDAGNVAEKILGINDSLGETPDSGGGVIDWFKENWAPVIGTLIGGPVGGAVAYLEERFGFMKTTFTEGGAELFDIWGRTWEYLHRKAVGGIRKITGSVHEGVGNTIRRFLQPWPGAQARFSQFWANLAFRAQSGMSRIIGYALNLVHRIAGIRPSWSGLWSGLKAAGDRVASLLQGILDRARSIGSRIRGAIGSLPGFGAGGIAHAAEGGPRGNLALVGEQGPEIVRLPQGSQVYPHGQSMGMLAAMGGGALRLELEWVGGRAGDQFIEWLQKNIRVRAGRGPDSVQKALGG